MEKHRGCEVGTGAVTRGAARPAKRRGRSSWMGNVLAQRVLGHEVACAVEPWEGAEEARGWEYA